MSINRKIGSLKTFPIGLGCMNMSAGYGPADDEASNKMLNKALDEGFSFLDTATLYGHGHSETLIGKSVSARRQEMVLASKCGLDKNGIDGRPATIKRQCEDSLKKLKTDYIDLYYLHRMDPKVPIEDSVGALGQLVEQGKIREIGLSEVSTETLKAGHKEFPIAALQSEYSLWSRTPERGILDFCREAAITVVPFCPLGRGFLTGHATDVSNLADDDLRCTIARPRFEAENFATNNKLLAPFGEIAGRAGCSMAQLALAWLLHQQDGSMIPIPGTRSVDHMLENAAAASVQLDDKTIAELDDLINESTVKGQRYVEARMLEADSEKD